MIASDVLFSINPVLPASFVGRIARETLDPTDTPVVSLNTRRMDRRESAPTLPEYTRIRRKRREMRQLPWRLGVCGLLLAYRIPQQACHAAAAAPPFLVGRPARQSVLPPRAFTKTGWLHTDIRLETLRGGYAPPDSSGADEEDADEVDAHEEGARESTADKVGDEAVVPEDDSAAEESASPLAPEGDTDDHDGRSVHVPSLDTFINYEEQEMPDALSSMAPILETTTTTMLDTTTTVEEVVELESVTVDATAEKNDDDSEEAWEESESEESNEVSADENADSDAVEALPAIDLSLEEAQEQSSLLRLEGKSLHDDAEYHAAAAAFGESAILLEGFLDESEECLEDWSTCRLHEALCHLKAEDSNAAVDACTRVLDRPSVMGAVRARALYRRAKAYLGLEEKDMALQDARAAAFLGDRRGVALYGELMRESSGSSLMSSGSSSSSSSASGMMEELASSSALFESLLSKSNAGDQSTGTDVTNNALPPFNPLSMLSGMGGGPSLGGNGLDTGGLAKSVISNLSKRLEDEGTQDTICKYLQQASGTQIQQYAGMAGMQLPETQAQRVANFLRGVTPKGIRRTVKHSKRVLYGVRLIRKTSKVISKYRNVLIWLCLLTWAKSAFLRPIPINKRMARLAAKKAAKLP